MTNEAHNPDAAAPQSSAAAGAAALPFAPPTVPGALGRPPRQAVWPNVIGVIGVIYAVGGIFMSGWQAVSTAFFDMFSGTFPAAAGPNPMEAMQPWAPYMIGLALGNIAVSLFLLIACFGLLMHRPWGRSLLLAWAVVKLVALVINSIVGIAMARAMMAETTAQGQGIPLFLSDFFIWISIIFNALFYGAFPVFMLIWLNLARSKAEVQRWRDEPAAPR